MHLEPVRAAVLPTVKLTLLMGVTSETVMYQGSMFSSDLETSMRLMADVVLAPGLTDAEVLETVDLTAYEHESLTDKPDVLIGELLHKVCIGFWLRKKSMQTL